jgi:hypothetical protein
LLIGSGVQHRAGIHQSQINNQQSTINNESTIKDHHINNLIVLIEQRLRAKH